MLWVAKQQHALSEYLNPIASKSKNIIYNSTVASIVN